MYISEATYNELNEFVQKCFQMNSICDNIAYNLGYKKMVATEPIFHEKFAHAFPGFADIISTLMLRLEARPIRKALEANIEEYENNVIMFMDLKNKVDEYRKAIIKLIEVADFNNDAEVRIEIENFLAMFTKYLDQVNVWAVKAEQYGEKVQKFDHDFADFTLL